MSRVGEAFGDALQRLHLRLGGDAAAGARVAACAEAVWDAAQEGHVCVDVDAVDDRERLRSSPVVGSPGAPDRGPLVLDDGTLYLRRLWLAETGLAGAIASLDGPMPAASGEAIERELARVFPGVPADDPQRRAVQAGLSRRLALLSGGPGTGKTTTMARLLVAFARLQPQARVCFAAPTGKAAARLAQSLASQLPALDPLGEVAARLPAAGLTVHRLLGLGSEGLERPADELPPLPWELVIVDEASMLDVELAARLALAMPPEGRLVLAGDADQLASVEAGAVFSESCAAGLSGAVRLVRNYRQAEAPGIAALAAALRDGRAEDAVAAAAAAIAGTPVSAHAVAEDAAAAYRLAVDSAAAFDPGAAGDPGAAARVLAAFDAHRVLAALREGPLGAAALNRAIAALVRGRVRAAPQAEWYPGRLVMVVRNEPDLGLFNGDVGVCLTTPEPAVAFAAGAGAVRWIPVRQMPACEDAYAMTVHKSQGSEFGSVALVPAPAGHALNTRELLYTGVTRARNALRLWAGAEAVAQAARRQTVRHGRLGERIRAAAAASASGPDASPP